MVYDIVNTTVWTFFSVLMLYQIFYIVIGLFVKKKYKPAKEQHSFAILIAGRNEEKVIGQLIDSIHKQNYDQNKIKIFVCADNCSPSDKTAQIAREKGCVVYERHDTTKIGKCYPLDLLLRSIDKDFPDYKPEGFFVFDADNILDVNYIKNMNDAFDSGEKIITSYRASKNFDESWLSMGASVAFIRECRFVHSPRNHFKVSTHVSGTGFLFSSEILNAKNGWNYGAMTEDLEFSCDQVLKGYKVAYCDDAIFYDEQPSTLKQTYRQRLRWQKGSYQVFNFFVAGMFKTFLNNVKFAFFDFFVYLSPLPLVSTSWSIVNGLWATIEAIFLILGGAPLFATVGILLLKLLKFFAMLYLGFFIFGSLAVVKDWKRIKTSAWKKILSMLAYPLFMICLIPIPFIALFKKVEWKPIVHNKTNDFENMAETEIVK